MAETRYRYELNMVTQPEAVTLAELKALLQASVIEPYSLCWRDDDSEPVFQSVGVLLGKIRRQTGKTETDRPLSRLYLASIYLGLCRTKNHASFSKPAHSLRPYTRRWISLPNKSGKTTARGFRVFLRIRRHFFGN